MKSSEMAEKLCLICCKFTATAAESQRRSKIGIETKSSEECMDTVESIDEDRLEMELSAVFLLRKVIDIPPDVCAQLLEEYGHFSTWVFFCRDCQAFVSQARFLFDQMTILQKKFNSLQREIKGEIMYSEVYQLNLTLATIPGMTQDTEAMKKVRSQVSYSKDDFKCMQDGRVALKRLGGKSLAENEDCQNTENTMPEGGIQFDDNGHNEALVASSTDLTSGADEGLEEGYFLFEKIKTEPENVEAATSSDSSDQMSEVCRSKKRKSPKMSIRNRPRDRNFSCDVCPKAFSQRHHLTRHKMIHEDKPFLCDVCKNCFHSEEDLKVHSLRNHAEEWEISLKRKGKVQKLTEDNRQKIASATMNLHKCTFCGKGYSRSDHLRYHMRSHTNERPFACDICGHTFKMKDSLINHKKCVHSGTKPFKCDDCGFAFAVANHLQQHRRRIHGVLPPPRVKPIHRCNICNKIFPKPNILEIHIRKHTGEKPFACGICEKAFTAKHLLRNHTVVHSEEKPYKCDICAKTFLSNRDMKYHQLMNHNS